MFYWLQRSRIPWTHGRKRNNETKPDKVKSIKEAAKPETKTQLRSFLGLAGYYRKFIPDFAAIGCPLTDWTRKGEPNKVRWGGPQETAFKTLENKLSDSPILHLPDLTKTLILRSDVSDKSIGVVLLQDHAGKVFPVANASKKLTNTQRAYSVMEKECLAIIWTIHRFEPFFFFFFVRTRVCSPDRSSSVIMPEEVQDC